MLRDFWSPPSAGAGVAFLEELSGDFEEGLSLGFDGELSLGFDEELSVDFEEELLEQGNLFTGDHLILEMCQLNKNYPTYTIYPFLNQGGSPNQKVVEPTCFFVSP